MLSGTKKRHLTRGNLNVAKKGNLKRETESLLIASQNNAIGTNHIKARIDKMQQNSRCRLCSDREETINRIISEFSEQAQKPYKTRHDCVGKAMYWKLCYYPNSCEKQSTYVKNSQRSWIIMKRSFTLKANAAN